MTLSFSDMTEHVINKEITVSASAPSNIAIVKYWGKKGTQEPVNPSISFTLSKARTKTNISYLYNKESLSLHFLFEGKSKSSFLPKLEQLTEKLKHYLPFLNSGQLKIESTNSFPHSSGIASSASSMASIAKGLFEIQKQIKPDTNTENESFLISEMARFGSGSACRSTNQGWVMWGKTQLKKESNNRYGISINEDVHPLFNDIQDSILVIRKGVKAVSSTVGHQLMNNHPYREGRIKQANDNIKKLLTALKDGDFINFAQVCEEEALSLHALMMSSSPAYTLMAPESLRAIKRIKKFREHQHVPITFTLDAGPNIHLIYPKKYSKIIVPFIKEHLEPLCENKEIIFDHISVK